MVKFVINKKTLALALPFQLFWDTDERILLSNLKDLFKNHIFFSLEDVCNVDVKPHLCRTENIRCQIKYFRRKLDSV